MHRDIVKIGYLLASSACLPACALSLQEMSAGHVGCSPGELVVSGHARSIGWSEGSETWVATCPGGQRYHCSKLTTTHAAAVFVPGAAPGSALTSSSQVSCTPEAPDEHWAQAPSRPPPPQPANDAFTAVAGFEFGSDAEAVRRSCAGASLTFRELGENRFACSGAPEDVGIPVTAVVETCGGRVCRIDLQANPDGASWSGVMDRFTKVRDALKKRYGALESTNTEALDDCSEPVKDCFAKGRVRTSARWLFPRGSELSITASGGKPGAKADLVLQYLKPDAKPVEPPRPAAPKPDEPKPSDGLDTVFLADGGRLRGTVFEDDKKTGVGIKLPDGATRRIKAESVKKVVYHGQ